MTQVVLVDDRDDIRALVRDVLEDDGYTVAETPDATTALAILRTSPDTLVVLFGMAPGATLLPMALNEPTVRRHAFVLLTAYPEGLTPEWRELLSALEVPVVAKPFALATLRGAVAAAAARVSRRNGHPVPA